MIQFFKIIKRHKLREKGREQKKEIERERQKEIERKGEIVQIAATLIHFIIGKVNIFSDFNQFEQIIICVKLNITFSRCEEMFEICIDKRMRM